VRGRAGGEGAPGAARAGAITVPDVMYGTPRRRVRGPAGGFLLRSAWSAIRSGEPP